MSEPKKSNFLTGAAILAFTIAITKVIGAVYKIPLYNILGDEGVAHFNVTYTIYTLLLTISTAGVPIAVSRLISEALANKKFNQLKRYHEMSLAAFGVVGIAGSLLMYIFAEQLAVFMNDIYVVKGVRVLAPAVFFACIIAVYRGYTQGFSDMVPTAISQVIEVLSKLVFGLTIALIISKSGGESSEIVAGAIVGVTIGLGIAIPILILRKRKLDKKFNKSIETVNNSVMTRAETLRHILSIAIPITISSSLLNLISLLDTSLILGQLTDGTSFLGWHLSGAGYTSENASILYGVYSKGITLFNLPSAFIVPITTSIVPAIATALAKNRNEEAKDVIESGLKVLNLIAMPAAVGLSVLAYPIFAVLYPNSHEMGPELLVLLGPASYFVCAQLVTGAILQATGNEKLALLAFPIGGVIKIIADIILISNPEINIIGAPIATIICYLIIVLINIVFIKTKLKRPPSITKVSVRPVICSAIMGVAAYAVYGLLSKLGFSVLVSLAITIVVAVLIYGVLIIALKAVTKEDMALIPRGEKIAKILKIK